MLLVALLVLGSPVSQSDAIMAEMMAAQHIPAAIVGIVRNGEVVVAKGYGEKEHGKGVVPDASTVFYIGSLSKALTAIGAMMLVDQGKLDLAKPAAFYVKGLPPTWKSITVEQFMAHTSGLQDKPGQPATFEDAIAEYTKLPLAFEPGSKFDYCNFNYSVMGKVIEAISGQSYLDYMQTVWSRAGMKNTGYPATSKNLAYGSQNERYHMVPEVRGGAYGVPSGYLSTTLDDMLALHAALVGHKMFSPATGKRMVEPYGGRTPGAFSLGWQTSYVKGHPVVRKNGATQGFESLYRWWPDDGSAVIVIVSRRGDDVDLAKINQRLGEAILK